MGSDGMRVRALGDPACCCGMLACWIVGVLRKGKEMVVSNIPRIPQRMV